MLTLYNVYVGQLRDLKVKLSREIIVLNVKVVLILQSSTSTHEIIVVLLVLSVISLMNKFDI